MDAATEQAVRDLGLDPQKIPPKEVRLVTRQDMESLRDPTLNLWAADPLNAKALAYSVETEHVKPAGFAFRNLYSHKDQKRHFLWEKTPDSGPYFHNLHASLPEIWKTGKVCLCEGPKDARAVWEFGIPVVAYLTSSPRKKHLEVLSRYADSIIWVQDNDPDTKRMTDVSEQLFRQCRQIGLRLYRYALVEKDPAQQLLVDRSVLDRLAQTYQRNL